MNTESFDQELQNLHYPSKDEFKIYNVYKSGEVILSRATNAELYGRSLVLVPQGNRSSINTYNCAKKLKYHGYLVEEEFNEAAYKEANDRYYRAEADIISRFKQCLFDEHGLTSTPKSEFLWNRSWEEGHSGGLSEVKNFFENWVDILTL